MTVAEQYLRLSGAYCDFLGGLRWAAQEDALEYKDGTTFAFTGEIALFLEGFACGGRLIHFGFILHLLQLIRHGHRGSPMVGLALGRAFEDAGRPLRNAGAFCAALCRDLPEALGRPDPREVLERLRNPVKPIRWFLVNFHDTFHPAEFPPLEPALFEREMLRRLEAYTQDELLTWLRTGRGPLKESGKTLARQLPPPRTLVGALATLLERPRLAGARAFVDQLLSALALPPRRSRPEVPVGGYADVTTYGPPDRLLPSQFALDEWDFLRRYADHELLYFRREEPHTRTRHELVVLLDQGVRTWGDVRLVLGAAVLALGRKAARDKQPFFVATTSGKGEVVDPVAADHETLGRLVEASDLSANPGLALERVLEQRGVGQRDVVLLTHPRNLKEEDVVAAARCATPETRLLALALDSRGTATLSTLRHGVPVSLRQFRVDFSKGAAPVVPPSVPRARAWRGDVEPIGFPFRFGTGGPVSAELFDFDQERRWLLTGSRDGMLHIWKSDGSGQMELLPRAVVQGRLLGKIETILGVSGGFVVAHRDQKRLDLAHYDLDSRNCTAHIVAVTAAEDGLTYSPEHHTVLVPSTYPAINIVLDLETGVCFSRETGPSEGRARAAWQTAAQGRLPPRKLPCIGRVTEIAERKLSWACGLESRLGQLRLFGVSPPWDPFVPLVDGRPSLAGCELLAAECRGEILAIKVRDRHRTPGLTIRLYRGPEGIPLAEYPVPFSSCGFTLSSDGRLLALHTSHGQVEVRHTFGGTLPVAATFSGSFSSVGQLLLGDRWLLLRKGRANYFLLNWEKGPLEVQQRTGSGAVRATAALLEDREGLQFLNESREGGAIPGVPGFPTGIPAYAQYDPQRFTQGASTSVTVVLDRFGQVAILNLQGDLVCMLFLFRDQLSAWLADGTCFGPASSKGQPTPEDLEKFGHALTQASDLERNKQCK